MQFQLSEPESTRTARRTKSFGPTSIPTVPAFYRNNKPEYWPLVVHIWQKGAFHTNFSVPAPEFNVSRETQRLSFSWAFLLAYDIEGRQSITAT